MKTVTIRIYIMNLTLYYNYYSIKPLPGKKMLTTFDLQHVNFPPKTIQKGG